MDVAHMDGRRLYGRTLLIWTDVAYIADFQNFHVLFVISVLFLVIAVLFIISGLFPVIAVLFVISWLFSTWVTVKDLRLNFRYIYTEFPCFGSLFISVRFTTVGIPLRLISA